MSFNSEYGYSDRTSLSVGLQLALDTESTTTPVGNPETTFKTKGISNPRFSVQHRLADGPVMNDWIPAFIFSFSPNFKDNEYSDDEQTLRSGGHELEGGFALTERSDTSIRGLTINYNLRLERKGQSTTDNETETITGGNNLTLGASWQYLIDNNTLGVSFELSNSASQKTDTKNGATTSFSKVSSITATRLGLIGSLQLTGGTVLTGLAGYVLPFDYDAETGAAPIETEFDSTTVLSVSLSSVF